jgi:hypothetical protein
MIFGAFDVAIHAGRLKGRALGERLLCERYAPAVEVKERRARTRGGRGRAGIWRAQCVVDV